MSTERSPEVRDHPSIPPARGAMREKSVTLLGAAPRRNRDLLDAQLARLLRQDGAQIQQHRSAQSKTYRTLTPNFIKLALNTTPQSITILASLWIPTHLLTLSQLFRIPPARPL